MNDFINFMNKYGFIVFGSFFLAVFLFSFFSLFKKLINVRKYYKNHEYDKCLNEIKRFSPLFSLRERNKQYLQMYLIGIHLVFDEYEEATQLLKGIKYHKYLYGKYLWECYIYLRKNDLTNAISSFENAKKCYHKQEIDFQIMNDIIIKLSNVEPITENKELTQKIIHPRVREFYVSVMNDGKK